jgi:hypothetical protein
MLQRETDIIALFNTERQAMHDSEADLSGWTMGPALDFHK